MKNVLLLTLALTTFSCFFNKKIASESKPVIHDKWEVLLQKYVSDNGCVNYKGFINDSILFNEYLYLLSISHPNDKNWTKEEKMAYWINSYNAYTIKLIVDNYPVNSIKDIGGSIYRVNTAWAKKFIVVEGYEYSLDNIEHDILRPKFNDGRVHAAVNCASESCPILYNHAFAANKLDDQLTKVFTRFIGDTDKNVITENELKLSKIFSWFSGDFKKDGKSVIDFINNYSEVNISANASISYLDYGWGLNECD